jgi:hypothetical protein
MTRCTICSTELRKDERAVWVDSETHINGADGHRHVPPSSLADRIRALPYRKNGLGGDVVHRGDLLRILEEFE